jgi:hypothetical protein
MSIFGLFGEVLKTPVSALKDIANIENNGSENTNTGQRWEDIKDEIEDIFDWE